MVGLDCGDRNCSRSETVVQPARQELDGSSSNRQFQAGRDGVWRYGA